jgi:hypothetical protein
MLRFRTVAPAGIVAVLSLAAVARLGAENWPQWRGPGSQGVSSETQLPTAWAPDKNVAWKAALPGSGHSSPIVWGDRVFVTAVIEGEVIPGAKAVPHTMGGKEFVHPDTTRSPARSSGIRRPTKAPCTTAVTAGAASQGRPPLPMARWSTRTSGLKASTPTTTRGSWRGRPSRSFRRSGWAPEPHPSCFRAW